mmetsp:Transcript_3372/g.4957  ORF Transcript_3372/g.4957 Transcript_3372/m.4957 type:complete len:222 (-) Transcript_3372:1465-2130(-)
MVWNSKNPPTFSIFVLYQMMLNLPIHPRNAVHMYPLLTTLLLGTPRFYNTPMLNSLGIKTTINVMNFVNVNSLTIQTLLMKMIGKHILPLLLLLLMMMIQTLILPPPIMVKMMSVLRLLRKNKKFAKNTTFYFKLPLQVLVMNVLVVIKVHLLIMVKKWKSLLHLVSPLPLKIYSHKKKKKKHSKTKPYGKNDSPRKPNKDKNVIHNALKNEKMLIKNKQK